MAVLAGFTTNCGVMKHALPTVSLTQLPNLSRLHLLALPDCLPPPSSTLSLFVRCLRRSLYLRLLHCCTIADFLAFAYVALHPHHPS